MKLRKATSYEAFQWMRYLRNSDDPGLVLRYQFRLVGNIDFEQLNHTLKMVISDKFFCLLSYFIEKQNSLFVGVNAFPEVVVEQVYEETFWNSGESIIPTGDRLFRFSYFIRTYAMH